MVVGEDWQGQGAHYKHKAFLAFPPNEFLTFPPNEFLTFPSDEFVGGNSCHYSTGVTAIKLLTIVCVIPNLTAYDVGVGTV